MVWTSLTAALTPPKGSILTRMRRFMLRLIGLKPLSENEVQHSVAFTVAVVALSAKIAKADGVVTDVEAEMFSQLFRTSEKDHANVRRVFDMAKQEVAGLDSYARQIATMLEEQPALKQNVFEGLFMIAASDGVLHQNEEQHLRHVAEIFGYSDLQYRAVRALFVHDPDDSYTILGVSPDTSNEILKSHYRRLVRENHPDTLIARGMPPALIEMATQKIAKINSAYDAIAQMRGL